MEQADKIEKAITELGGKIESPAKGESPKEYFDSLVSQYNRLNKT